MALYTFDYLPMENARVHIQQYDGTEPLQSVDAGFCVYTKIGRRARG